MLTARYRITPLRHYGILHLLKVLSRGSLAAPFEERLSYPCPHHSVQLLQVPLHTPKRVAQLAHLHDHGQDEIDQ